MNSLEKTLGEYRQWKDNLITVIDDNFDFIIEILEVSCGLSVSLEELNNNNDDVISKAIQLDKNNNGYNLFFFENDTYYLIEEKNINRNLSIPLVDCNINSFMLKNYLRANKLDKIRFLEYFMEKVPEIEKKLQERMESSNWKDIDEALKQLRGITLNT